jgi:hypothetical protein
MASAWGFGGAFTGSLTKSPVGQLCEQSRKARIRIVKVDSHDDVLGKIPHE